MLVFREGRKVVAGPALCRAFVSKLLQVAGTPSDEVLLGLLLESGELECALADTDSPITRQIENATDRLADSLVRRVPLRVAAPLDDDVFVPRELTVSRAEGFAYYALHPLSYSDAVESMSLGSSVAVVGIRSIGTTLSAVVLAAARKQGCAAERITVRPDGNPWDRTMRFSMDQGKWVEEQLRRGAQFLVVDEGPGLSGSSFLSVGEALVRQGVPIQNITLVCSVDPDLAALRAPDAAERWRRFRSCVVRTPRRIPCDTATYFAGGKWRETFDGECPASWISFERLKYRDDRSVFKFEGLGAHGRAVLDRAQALATAGFSPAAESVGAGFVRYEWVEGQTPRKLSRSILERIAEYCAWRAKEFAVDDAVDLGPMVASNWLAAFGTDYECEAKLPVERVVVADGKMQPYEWLQTESGLLRVDAVDHGDDHFYPGPADIAWDLAGTIVEWQLDTPASDYLLSRYARMSGDAAQSRISKYLLAYALFRYGYCRLGAECMRGSEEEPRLARDAERYRAVAMGYAQVQIAA